MRRAWVAGAMAALVMALLGARPAAAEGELVVSSDGTSWSGSLTQPLFAAGSRWVPGEQRTASFWIGNRAGTGADVAILARLAADADPVLTEDVHLEVRRPSARWSALPVDGAARRLPGEALPAGDEERIEVRARFAAGAGNPTQARRLPLEFAVILSRSPTTSPPDPAGPESGGLPDTGGPDTWFLVVGLLLIGGGTFLVVSTSRLTSWKEDRDELPEDAPR